MALVDVNGYKALYHPYDGYVLPYRLIYPKNYDSSKSYPLLVWLHGSGEMGKNNTSQVSSSWSLAAGYNNSTQAYSEWEMFVICPQIPGIVMGQSMPLGYYNSFYQSTDKIFQTSFYGSQNDDYMPSMGWVNLAIIDLINSYKNGNIVFYNEVGDDDSEESTAIKLGIVSYTGEELERCNVNTNKIYISGSSLGGYVCQHLLKSGRELFAAAMLFQPIQFISANRDYYTTTSDDYNSEKALRLNREIERYSHIPVLMSVASNDTISGYSPVVGFCNAFNDVYTRLGTENKFIFTQPGSIGHSITVTNNIFDKTKKFNSSIHIEQEYSSEKEICGMDWLFSQSKLDNIPLDPYIGEEQYYYPDRNYIYTSYNYIPYTGRSYNVVCSNKLNPFYIHIYPNSYEFNFTDNEYDFVFGATTVIRVENMNNCSVKVLSPRKYGYII